MFPFLRTRCDLFSDSGPLTEILNSSILPPRPLSSTVADQAQSGELTPQVPDNLTVFGDVSGLVAITTMSSTGPIICRRFTWLR